MKGQIVFEYVIAVFILFSIIIYSINVLSTIVSGYHSRFLNSFMESKALQISEVLMNDPKNGVVKVWPQLDTDKMTAFDQTCRDTDGYMDLLKAFGLMESEPYEVYHHMNIVINQSTTKFVDCGRSPPEKMNKAVVTRFGVLPSNKIATMQVIVW